MLKELNQAFGALCNVTSTTALALEEGTKILRIKGITSKQIAALESVKALQEAKEGLSDKELTAAIELLSLVD